MLCEMCSAPNAIYKIEVEGSRLSVCEKCSRYGKILSKAAPEVKKEKKPVQLAAPVKQTETVQMIKTEYPFLIKQAREKLGLKQEELAKKLDEKESLLHKIESGHMKPDLALARKLEKFLKVSLVEQLEIAPGGADKDTKKPAGVTIGDLIRIK